MGITADGYFDWMKIDPGPPWKVNGGRNGGKGMVPHSAEGYRRVLREILWGPRRASWAASILTDDAYQHYPVWAQTWTSGSGYPNNNFYAFEVEGCGSVPGIPFEPWTQFQIDTVIRMGQDLREFYGWTAKRPVSATDITATCYEHNECVRFGSEYTSCPSGRNPWDILIPAINGGSMAEVTKAEFAALFAFSLDTRKLTVALGHGLAAVAKQTGVNQQDIDDIEAELEEQRKKMVALAGFLKDNDG